MTSQFIALHLQKALITSIVINHGCRVPIAHAYSRLYLSTIVSVISFLSGYIATIAATGSYIGSSSLICLSGAYTGSSASPSNSGGPAVEPVRISTSFGVPGDNSELWEQADGTLMPCTKCILPSTHTVFNTRCLIHGVNP